MEQAMYSAPLLSTTTFQRGMLLGLLAVVLLANPTTVFTVPSEYDTGTQNYAFEFLTFKAHVPNQTFLEVFCHIPTGNLNFVKMGTGYLARFNISMTVFNKITWQAENLSHTDSVFVQQGASGSTQGQAQIARFGLFLEAGDYLATVKLTDDQTFEYFNLDHSLKIPNYWSDELKISTLKLSTSISQSDEDSELAKSNMHIARNVAHIFGNNHEVVYVYAELYNLSYPENGSNQKFTVNYSVVDNSGNKIKTGVDELRKPGPTCMVTLAIPINELGSGQYKLVLEIEDSANSQRATSSANFSVIKPLVSHSDDEFDQNLRQLACVVSQHEINQIASLPVNQRANGLEQLWKKLDPTPETTLNEFMIEYENRVSFANQHFSNGDGDGWQTDQGRIYLRNGQPDNIDRIRNKNDHQKYEIWEYKNLDLRYLFVGEIGSGHFRLAQRTESSNRPFTPLQE